MSFRAKLPGRRSDGPAPRTIRLLPWRTPHPCHSPADDAARLAARDGAVVCDLAPLRVLAIEGADAETFLQGQLSCDVKGLAPGTCRYGSFNSPKGRMLANFVLWRSPAAGDRFEMLLPEDIAEPVAKRLRMYVLRSKVVLTDVSADTRRFGVGGPAAADGAGRGARSGSRGARSACSRTGNGPRAARARASSCWRRRRGRRRAGAIRRSRDRGRIRRLAMAHHPRRSAGHHGGDAGSRSSRRPRTGTFSAASISRRAAIPGRRSSPGRSTSAGSRSGRSCSTPTCRTSRPGTGSSVRPSTPSPAAPSSTRRRLPGADSICWRCCRSRRAGTRRCAPSRARRPAARRASAPLRHPCRDGAARAPVLIRARMCLALIAFGVHPRVPGRHRRESR